jgi:hypothetical protein
LAQRGVGFSIDNQRTGEAQLADGKADAALSFRTPSPRFPPGRQRALDACLFIITGGETRPGGRRSPHKEQIGVDPRHSRQRLGADGDNRMFKYLPPSRITSIRGWSTSATAMPGCG